MKEFLDFADTAAVLVTGALLNSLWQGIVLVALSWGGLQLVRGANARTRYAVWLATLTGVLLLPVLNVISGAGRAQGAARPAVQVAAAQPQSLPSRSETGDFVPRQLEAVAGAHAANEMNVARAAQPEADGGAGSADFDGKGAAAWFRVRMLSRMWWVGLMLGWLVIAGGLTARLVWSYCCIQKLRRSCEPVDEETRRRFKRLVREQNIGRSVSLLSSTRVLMPLAIGLTQPVIVVPETLSERLTGEEFEQVLLHELAHVRRRDDWTNLFQKIAESVFFFMPAILWAGRRLNLEREVACDEWVIATTGAGRPYALCLTKLAELAMNDRRHALASAAAIGQKQIYRRVQFLLQHGKSSVPRLSKPGFVVPLVFLLVASVQCARMSPLIAVTLPPATRDSRADGSLEVETTATALEESSPARVVAAVWNEGRASAERQAFPSAGNASASLFAPGEPAAAQTGAPAQTGVQPQTGVPAQTAPLTAATEPRPESDGAAAAPSARADSAALSNTPASPPSEATSANETFNAAAAIAAASGLSSDDSRAAALVSIARQLRGGSVPPSYFEAAARIRSPAEKSRALSALLGHGLDGSELIRLMRLAAQISSDDEKANLLAQVAAVCPAADDAALTAYLGAVRSIGSSWEKERALRALLQKGGLSDTILGQVAGLARNNISSEESRQNILEIINRRL